MSVIGGVHDHQMFENQSDRHSPKHSRDSLRPPSPSLQKWMSKFQAVLQESESLVVVEIWSKKVCSLTLTVTVWVCSTVALPVVKLDHVALLNLVFTKLNAGPLCQDRNFKEIISYRTEIG
jgi:hypothetical protein